MTIRPWAAALLYLGFACGPLLAQDRSARDPIAAQVVRPELIFRHERTIGLTETQRAAITAEVKNVQARLLDLNWDLKAAVDRLVELMDTARVDEAAVVAQLDRVLAVEREIKRAQLVASVRLKNQLTPEQQRQLKELREAQPAR